MHLASLKGHADVVKLLLDQDGIDVNAEDKYGGTPLDKASNKGHTQVMNLLETGTF